ncbi:MAG: hypothetical protein ACREX8_08150, partial [Gammaproteobacteria bacterium]
SPPPAGDPMSIPMEPSADMRQAANHLRQLYVALTREGFSEQQALVIIGQCIAGQRGDGSKQ